MTITNIVLILVVLGIAVFAVYYVVKKKKTEEVEKKDAEVYSRRLIWKK